jgi:hypothetical protein
MKVSPALRVGLGVGIGDIYIVIRMIYYHSDFVLSIGEHVLVILYTLSVKSLFTRNLLGNLSIFSYKLRTGLLITPLR